MLDELMTSISYKGDKKKILCLSHLDFEIERRTDVATETEGSHTVKCAGLINNFCGYCIRKRKAIYFQ